MSLKIFLEYLYIEGIISDKINKLAADTEYDPKELQDKFQKYRQQYKLDINQFNTIEDLVTKFDEIETGVLKTKTQYKKAAGIAGLTSNVDYIEIPVSDEHIQAYVPLNWNASKVIASTRVGGVEGKWCTAYQKDIAYWNSYIHDDDSVLAYVLIDKWEHREEETPQEIAKFAIQVQPSGQITVWDQNDSPANDMRDELSSDVIVKFIESNWDSIKEKIPLHYTFLTEIEGLLIHRVIDDPFEYIIKDQSGETFIFNFNPKTFSVDNFVARYDGNHENVHLGIFMKNYPKTFQYFWDKHLAPMIQKEIDGQLSTPAVKMPEFHVKEKAITVHYTEDELLVLLHNNNKLDSGIYDTLEQGYIDFDSDAGRYLEDLVKYYVDDDNKDLIKQITGIDVDNDEDWEEKIELDFEDIYFSLIDGERRGMESYYFTNLQKQVRNFVNDLGFEASDDSNFTWMHTFFFEDNANLFLGLLAESYWFSPFLDYTDFAQHESEVPFLAFDYLDADEINEDSLMGFDEDEMNEFLNRELKASL